MSGQTVWMVVRDYGHDGLALPHGLFAQKATAVEHARRVLRGGTGANVWVIPYTIGAALIDCFSPESVNGAEQVLAS